MKNIIYFVVGLLLISSFATISIGKEAGNQYKTINLKFSGLEVKDSIDSYIELNFEGAGGRLYNSCQPVLPIYTTTIDLPFGTQITNIECKIGEIQTIVLSNKIVPAPTPVISGIDDTKDAEYIMDETIYNSNEFFPNNWFDYHVGVGRDENKDHKTFLNIRAFPVRYSPGTDTIEYVKNLDLTITYLILENDPFPSNSQYNLVIIAPQKFKNDLQKLVAHKNKFGVQTLLKTTEEIYSQYTGVDKPEQIKYFIKYALETYDNDYVLLVGGLKSIIWGNPKDDRNQASKDWYIPVRYSNLVENDATHDPGFLCDLYYADIYKEGGVFDSWDSNGDGIFAKWDKTSGKDVLDLYPDVYIGRLPCRNNIEVKIMVNKIINYEKTPAGSWYNTMILCGGDSFDDTGTNYKEGEVVCDRVANDYMSEFNQIKLYASNKVTDPTHTPASANIVRELSNGAGHLLLDGHANPFGWTTHWPGEFSGHDSWTKRFQIQDFPNIFNFKKLPICCVEGCHNSQFNVSILSTKSDRDNGNHTWCYGMPVPECWSEWLTRKVGGGSIATIGNSGLGYGATGEHGDLDNDNKTEPDILEKFGGYYFDQFYYIFDQGVDILGECHSGAINNYLDTHPGMDDQTDAKEMEQMILIGDPSLKIGGYSLVNGLTTEIVDAGAGILGSPLEEIMFQAAAYNGQGKINFNWDFNNDGQYDAEGEVASWTWNIPGAYWINLKATDETGQSDNYETLIVIEIGAFKPVTPSGQTNIKAGVEYTYTTSVNTQGGYWNYVYYKFSWGDETETDWIESPSTSHTWKKQGNYAIKTKALLVHESSDSDNQDSKETEWSDPLIISLTKTRQSTIYQFILNFFENHPNLFPVIRQLLGL
jgi:hypothetical protein